jgi:uncharacterized protein (TIGR02452 family)
VNSHHYTDHIIYSPFVPFFRDTHGNFIEKPYRTSVLTVPAPYAVDAQEKEIEAYQQTLDKRMELLLSIAVIHGYRNLILGAWGCGAFGNDPEFVAERFYHYLKENHKFAGAFDNIVFSVMDTTPDLYCYTPFYKYFAEFKNE